MKNPKIDSPSAYMEMFGLLAASTASFHEKPITLANHRQLHELTERTEPLDINCFEAHLFSLLALD